MTTPLLYNLHVPVGLTTKRCIAFALCLAFVLLLACSVPGSHPATLAISAVVLFFLFVVVCSVLLQSDIVYLPIARRSLASPRAPPFS